MVSLVWDVDIMDIKVTDEFFENEILGPMKDCMDEWKKWDLTGPNEISLTTSDTKTLTVHFIIMFSCFMESIKVLAKDTKLKTKQYRELCLYHLIFTDVINYFAKYIKIARDAGEDGLDYIMLCCLANVYVFHNEKMVDYKKKMSQIIQSHETENAQHCLSQMTL